MSKREKRRSLVMYLISILIAVLITSACGAEVTPTKEGEVGSPTVSATSTAETPQEQSTMTASASVESTQASQATEQAAQATSPQNYKVGDVVGIGDLSLVVLGWNWTEGNDFAKPEAGNKFLAVEMLVVNKGEKADSISTLMQMSLKDQTSQKYSVDLLAASAAGADSPEGEIAPGERLRGKVWFQVPEGATGLVFVFDADIFGRGKIFVDLGSEPVSLEPPAELAGETAQTTYKIGDVVKIGDLSLTMNGVSTPAGDSFARPDPGNKFVVVDMTLENRGGKAESISTIMQMSLKDATGQKYGVSLMATASSGGSSPDGELAAGEKVRGQVGFEVPENAQGLTFVFDADVFGKGKVFIALQ